MVIAKKGQCLGQKRFPSKLVGRTGIACYCLCSLSTHTHEFLRITVIKRIFQIHSKWSYVCVRFEKLKKSYLAGFPTPYDIRPSTCSCQLILTALLFLIWTCVPSYFVINKVLKCRVERRVILGSQPRCILKYPLGWVVVFRKLPTIIIIQRCRGSL